MFGSIVFQALDSLGCRQILVHRSDDSIRRFFYWLTLRQYKPLIPPMFIRDRSNLQELASSLEDCRSSINGIINCAGSVSLSDHAIGQENHITILNKVLYLTKEFKPNYVLHTSTAFVPSISSGLGTWKPHNLYEEIKHRCDKILTDAELDGTKKIILRPSILIHDSYISIPSVGHGVYRFWYEICKTAVCRNVRDEGTPPAIVIPTNNNLGLDLITENGLLNSMTTILTQDEPNIGSTPREYSVVSRHPTKLSELAIMMTHSSEHLIRFILSPHRAASPRLSKIHPFIPYIQTPLDTSFHQNTTIMFDGHDKRYLLEQFRQIFRMVRDRDSFQVITERDNPNSQEPSSSCFERDKYLSPLVYKYSFYN